MKLRNSLLSCTVIFGALSAAPALAQDWYVQGFAGYGFNEDLTFSGIIGGAPNSVFTGLDDGFNVGAAIGYNFSSLSSNGINLRGEVELSYGESDVDAVNFSGNGPGFEVPASGDISSTFLFANLLLDFDTSSAWSPYVGGGIGAGFIDQNVVYGPAAVAITGSDEVFAAQLIAGVSYDISEKTSLFGDVRYQRAFDVEGLRTSPGGVSIVSDDLDRTALNLGVRFKF